MGCSLCTKSYPTLFEMQGRKAVVKAQEQATIDIELLQRTIEACPVKAIAYTE
jgi:ferredoxin